MERTTVFVMFCCFTIVCLIIEVYLCYSMISNGFTAGKAVTGLVDGSIMVACGKLFVRVVSKAFLQPDDIISFSKLHRFASDRCRIVDQDAQADLDDFATRQHLLTEILSFAEESLRGWLPGSHFELCIFVDRDQPLLLAYFDSNRASTARSMQYREENPYWYVEKNYEVLKVLGDPSSHPRIIQNTGRKESKYSFVSTQQRKQLKSTMLWCIDVAAPCAIVVSSNATNAFRESDPEVTSFIKFVGNLALSDLLDRRFIHRIRQLRPDLFPPAATTSV
jgi:hypothetical protein